MQYYVVDAFTQALFKGNPAGVCLLERWPEDGVMQSIAAENNLAETAFVVPGDGVYDLRWFTPAVEVDLCGHATLASAFVVNRFVDPKADTVIFHTKSGPLTVVKKGELLEMDFPSRKPEPTQVLPAMEAAVGTKVLEAHRARDLVLLLEAEEQVRSLKPDGERLKEIADFGVVVTAPGGEVDFVSRFFGPNVGVPEDPVTGSSHATLVPFWAGRLGKNKLVARQLSPRGGTLYCENGVDRVKIGGYAALYLEGTLHI